MSKLHLRDRVIMNEDAARTLHRCGLLEDTKSTSRLKGKVVSIGDNNMVHILLDNNGAVRVYHGKHFRKERTPNH